MQLLGDALQRLERSGVLQARHVEARIGFLAPERRAFHAVVENSLSAPGLRSCALDGCGAREAHPTHFKSCAACRAVVYCCREHQRSGGLASPQAGVQGGAQGGCCGGRWGGAERRVRTGRTARDTQKRAPLQASHQTHLRSCSFS